MQLPRRRRNGLFVVLAAAALLVLGIFGAAQPDPPSGSGGAAAGPADSATVARRDFVRTVRVTGTVAAVRSSTVSVPRLSGPGQNSLVITRLVRGGASIRRGELLVEFDRQQQLSNAFDRRAEYLDLEEQITRKRAEQDAARAKDETELKQAEHDAERARLEMLKNEFLPQIEVEKNTQRLEEAEAKLEQLRATFDLKRRAAAADLRILEIRRDRARNAMQHAEKNAERMAILSPLDGMAVLKTVWKGNQMAEVQEGEEVRPGVPIVDVVDPTAMLVRAQVNQADISLLRVDQRARVALDAYPDLAFEGRVEQVSPLGAISTLNPQVRTFVAIIAISGSHEKLMPDLTAAVDVEVERLPRALVAPRDVLVREGDAYYVRVRRGDRVERRAVKIAKLSDHEAAIASGVDEGTVVLRGGAAAGGP
jgi:multidrug efflux pump subunit AcrA (membrane-fusion protein)